MAAKKKIVKTITSGLTMGVHTSASIERVGTLDGRVNRGGCEYAFRKMWLDKDGNLIADAGCSTVYVCSAKEIPEFSEFFIQLVA